jgi:hypothetical protein
MIKKLALIVTIILILSISLPQPVQAATGYTVSGTITLNGVGLKNVVVAISSTSYSAVTNGLGNYAIHYVPKGTSGYLTPSLAGYTFTPLNIHILSLPASLTSQNFTAKVALAFYSISGKVSISSAGLAGVKITLGSYSTTTTTTGTYLFTNLPSGTSGKLTPKLTGYVFTPTSITVSNLHASLSSQNFTAAVAYQISGKVTLGSGGPALAGVTVAFGSYKAVTSSTGTYTIRNIPPGTTAKLTASLAGYTFSPTSITITNLQSNLHSQNFVATKVYSIAGKVTVGSAGLAGVTISFGSFNSKTTSTGAYTINNIPKGTAGTLIPSLTSYTFKPTRITISTISANLTGQNFAATHH